MALWDGLYSIHLSLFQTCSKRWYSISVYVLSQALMASARNPFVQKLLWKFYHSGHMLLWTSTIFQSLYGLVLPCYCLSVYDIKQVGCPRVQLVVICWSVLWSCSAHLLSCSPCLVSVCPFFSVTGLFVVKYFPVIVFVVSSGVSASLARLSVDILLSFLTSFLNLIVYLGVLFLCFSLCWSCSAII